MIIIILSDAEILCTLLVKKTQVINPCKKQKLFFPKRIIFTKTFTFSNYNSSLFSLGCYYIDYTQIESFHIENVKDFILKNHFRAKQILIFIIFTKQRRTSTTNTHRTKSCINI